MPAVLITGANGFVGNEFCRRALSESWQVRGAVRSVSHGNLPKGADAVQVGEIGPLTDWTTALQGVDVVIHLAARVHVMRETAGNPLAEFRRVNTDGTRRLAEAAAAGGVKTFIYLSTVKVNGDQTIERPFSERDEPDPGGPYAISKWEAEQALQSIALTSSMSVVVLRPPLVYGPGVKGNMLRLMDFVRRGCPVPVCSLPNRRSFIGLGNLVDGIAHVALGRHASPVQTYLLSDGEDISTAELLEKIAHAMGRKARLWLIPGPLLDVLSRLAPPVRPVIDRLTGSLVVDSALFRATLNWSPPESVDSGISGMVRSYLAGRRRNDT